MPIWDADQYLRFADERTQPARDLLARIPLAAPGRIMDLGCGPGNSTALLRARWPSARVTGLDGSEEMLAAARKDVPEGDWVREDISAWAPQERFDLVYTNATLQWVPDHAALLPRLLDAVAEDGVFAAQMPHNHDQPSHALMRQVAGEGPWRGRADGARMPSAVRDPGFYYDLLAPRCRRVELWETTYLHTMDSAEAILEWTRGTGLRPYLQALEPGERPEFERRYLAALREAYRPSADGKLIFPFPRLFILAFR